MLLPEYVGEKVTQKSNRDGSGGRRAGQEFEGWVGTEGEGRVM